MSDDETIYVVSSVGKDEDSGNELWGVFAYGEREPIDVHGSFQAADEARERFEKHEVSEMIAGS